MSAIVAQQHDEQDTSPPQTCHPSMMRWFTSDLHFGHANVIRYSRRPFHSVDEMNNALVSAWNSVVSADDEVWVLGDLAMRSIDESLPMAGKLVGSKHLVLGNHDKPFRSRKRKDFWTERYLSDGGFVELHNGEVGLTLENGLEVLMCHFPYEGDSGDHDRYVAERPRDEGLWLLHGHVHPKWRQRGRMINLGVDAWGGVPVPESTVIELIDRGENVLERLPWV